MIRPSAKEIQAVAEAARVPIPLDVAERTFNSSAGGARSGNHKDRCRACADSVGRTPTIAASNVGNSRGAEAKIQRLTRFTRSINYLGLSSLGELAADRRGQRATAMSGCRSFHEQSR